MKPYYVNKSGSLFCGDCAFLRNYPDNRKECAHVSNATFVPAEGCKIIGRLKFSKKISELNLNHRCQFFRRKYPLTLWQWLKIKLKSIFTIKT